jgi:hypothetical protein
MPLLPDSIRYSETMEASPAELVEAGARCADTDLALRGGDRPQ